MTPIDELPITIDEYDPTRPLVSVLIPAYNHERWVQDALNSVWAQTYRNIEVILINDGSTDTTGSKIARFRRERSERFRYIEKKNEGVVKAMNLGLRFVRGDFVTILASDDLLSPEKFSVQVRLLEACPHVDSVFCPQNVMDEGGHITGQRGRLDDRWVRLIGCGLREPASPPDQWDVAELVLGAVAHPFMPQSAMARTSVYRALNGFDERTELDDIDFNLRAAVAGFVPRYHPEVLHSVRMHGANQSSRPWWMYSETLAAVDRFFANPGVPRRLYPYRRYLHALQTQILAGNLRHAGNMGDALPQYARLLIRYPDRFLALATRYLGRRVGEIARRRWEGGFA